MLGEPRREILHYNLVKSVVAAISLIFSEGEGGKLHYADSVVRTILKSNPKWGANDRKFIAHTVYEIVRWWRKLWNIYGIESTLVEPALWNLTGIHFAVSGYKLPDWKEFGQAHTIPLDKRIEEAEKIRKVRESVPDWLDELGENELGERWDRELHCLNIQAPVVIRVNTLKATIGEVRDRLNGENVATTVIQSHPDALQLDVRKNIFQTKSFHEGLFEVQDASSQEIAYFMNVKPGMRVIDACAGGGGKALHLGAIMRNKGKIIALDLHEWKLNELHKRSARAGVDIIETRTITSDKIIKRLEKSADALLLDVPCSGLGTLRRNPDIKWKLNPDALERIRNEQYQIINAYSGMVRPGGKLFYSTCSILPSENEAVIEKFTGAHNDFRKTAEKRISPSDSGFDGFYVASLERLNFSQRR